MFIIDGSVKVMPLSVAAEGGALEQDDSGTKMPAVMLYLETEAGYIDVIIPTENIDQITNALQNAKKDTEAELNSSLVVSKDISDADKISEAHNKLKG